MRRILIAAACALAPVVALAQSYPTMTGTSAPWSLHYTPTPSEWQNEFSSKQDYGASTAISVEQCGAKGDGVTDDAPAIMACGNQYGHITSGAKAYYLGTPITWNTHPVKWDGAGWNEVPSIGGTRLLISQTTASAITISGNARGTSLNDIALVETQPAPASGWTPTVYPCAINVNNTAGRVELHNILFAPVYDGVCASLSGRLVMNGMFGQPIHRAATIDASYDVDHVGQVHFWPLWNGDPNIMLWQQQNGDMFQLARTDGFVANDIFVYGYHSAIHLVDSSYGSASKIDIATLYTDATKWPIWVEAGNDAFNLYPTMHVGSLWADGELVGPAGGGGVPVPGGAAIMVAAGGRVDLFVDHFDAERYQSSPVQLLSTLPFTNLRFGSFFATIYDQLNDGSPAILTTSSSQTSFPHSISIATTPILTTGFANMQIINGGTNTMFSWPGYQNSATQVVATAGSTYSTPDYTRGLILSPVANAAIDGNTWQLPPHPHDGDMVYLICTQVMTNLTVVPSPSGAAYPIVGLPPATLPHNTPLTYFFSYANQNWVNGPL